ncbi:MAG: pyridoxal 5'-phosphate synthase glutaminase subunit PdxT [Syntrophales bacterium]|nr:pyridoxal 5'-phosphate synthase glutaminase subunit PdxT [Syntrophales bacterium]MDD5233997.1 pyridoxal 5'-phosphate synthase glutaminase subunit PdxT [Syntrophales bacterium]MDD5533947.1 pyridoxal 5'-phosphate synthase glutaminase subunit PdxT [Syntrophales bacterium]
MQVGVLALQGAFREHSKMIEKNGEKAVEIRLPVELDRVSALVIPGGESTTISKLMVEYAFPERIKEFAASGRPVFGTCAGMIVLAGNQDGRRQDLLGLIDIDVKRNAYGRQVASREVDLEIETLGGEPFRAVFIRAPIIEKLGPGVIPLARYLDKVVMARQENIIVTAFHPELTGDPRIHRYFLNMAGEWEKNPFAFRRPQAHSA